MLSADGCACLLTRSCRMHPTRTAMNSKQRTQQQALTKLARQVSFRCQGHGSQYKAAPEGSLAPEHPSMLDTPQAQALPLPEQAPDAQEGAQLCKHITHQGCFIICCLTI